MAELSSVKKTFDKLKGSPPLIHRDHPRYAGSALWAKSLHMRVQRQWAMLIMTDAWLGRCLMQERQKPVHAGTGYSLSWPSPLAFL